MEVWGSAGKLWMYEHAVLDSEKECGVIVVCQRWPNIHSQDVRAFVCVWVFESGSGCRGRFPPMLCWHHVAVTVTACVEERRRRRVMVGGGAGCNKYGWCERQGFVAVYSSAQTAHSSPADVPAPLLLCRIDEPSTQVSSRSLYIDKAIMHAFLLCITVSPLSRQMGCQSDIFPHTSALCCEEDVGSKCRVAAVLHWKPEVFQLSWETSELHTKETC